MRNKKSDEPEKTPEQQALEQRVDAMMDPTKPDESAAPKLPEPPQEQVPVVEPPSQKSVQTAPELPGKPRKKIDVSHDSDSTDKTNAGEAPESVAAAAVPTSALLIDNLDEITKDIAEPESQTEPETEAKPEEPADPVGQGDQFSDTKTDEAVDDIVANEGDVMLAVQDASAARSNSKTKKPPGGSSWKDKLRSLLKNKWTWIVVVILFGVLLGVPATRYKLVGVVVKESVSVSVTDSKTHTPVSSATVDIAGKSAKTDANGKVTVRTSPGHATLTVTKKYYKTTSSPLFISFKAANSNVKLQATGRQVPITVTNKITGKPVSGAEIKALGTTAKTDKNGKATVVLPTKTATAPVAISLKGYNTTNGSVTITDQAVAANKFTVTPAGTVYFLSNLNGTIDVVKTNLDGSNRHTVLTGTGHEDRNTTSLLASRDWHYVVLKARRDTTQPALYLIDTSNDKVTQFDTGDANFTLVGWYGHSFIYDLTRNTVPAWQANHEVLKSYDAENKQLNQLDQTQAEGDASSYAYQSFLNFYILNGVVVYNTQWYSFAPGGAAPDLGTKNDTVRAVQPNGQNKKDYQSFPAATTGYIQAALYEPQAVYYAVYDNSTNKSNFYEYEDQAVKTASGVDQDDFNKSYPTYLLSPSGNQTFWTEFRDGKNTLFTGDANAKSPKQIATLSDYSPYGWYSDSYVLVSKNSSELYVMPANDVNAKPLKVTDYYKPAQTFSGYGYGYGGL